jgi:hypothetical protein
VSARLRLKSPASFLPAILFKTAQGLQSAEFHFYCYFPFTRVLNFPCSTQLVITFFAQNLFKMQKSNFTAKQYLKTCSLRTAHRSSHKTNVCFIHLP